MDKPANNYISMKPSGKLTSEGNFEDSEIVDYDIFMDENNTNHYSGKYSFSDYKSSYKSSFVHSKADSKATNNNNKYKYSFESTTFIRTSNEIADVFRENLFTKGSIIASIFDFISNNQNIIMLLNVDDMENFFPYLGLKYKAKRKDALELDRDFQRNYNLEILRSVLFGKTTEKSLKEVTSEKNIREIGLELKMAYKVLFMKILIEMSCLKYLQESFQSFVKLESTIENCKGLNKLLFSLLSSVNIKNFDEIYGKEQGFRQNLKDFNTNSGFLKAQIEKIKLFKSFFKHNSDFSREIQEKLELFSNFQNLLSIYEDFEKKLKSHFDIIKDEQSNYTLNYEELRVVLRKICENYLDTEKNWEILLILAEKKLTEVLKLEPAVKECVIFNEKINKFNLIFRKVFNYSVEKPQTFFSKIGSLETFLQSSPGFQQNDVFIDKLYEINRLKMELMKLAKEIKRYRKEKISNNEFSVVLYSIIEETERIYEKLLKRVILGQNQLDFIKNMTVQENDLEKIMSKLKEKSEGFEAAVKANSMEIEDFLRNLTSLSVVYQEANILLKKSNILFVDSEQKNKNELRLTDSIEWSFKNLNNLIAHFKGPDLKVIAAMNEDIKESKQIFKLLLTIRKLDEDLEEEKFISMNAKLENLINHFREYKSAFNNNEELRDKCESLYAELIKASSFLMNYYLEKLGKKVLNRKIAINLIDSLDINNINQETIVDIEKILKNVFFIEQNLEENFYHSNKKIVLAAKIQFLGQSLSLFQRNFEELQVISKEKSKDNFNHKEFFNKTISEFSTTLKLDPLEPQMNRKTSSKEIIPLKESPKNEKNQEEFNKEDLLYCLERYIQRNKSLFDIESQSQEFEKEKKSFLQYESHFNSILKTLVMEGKSRFEENAEKYEEIENYIRKCKEFKKFFCNVINVHQEYYKYLKEVEKYVTSIDYWLRVFQTLVGSLKAIYKIKTLSAFQKDNEWFSPETLKKIKGFAQELYILSAKAKKIVNNEAVNLFNKQAVVIIEEMVEFLNMLYFNLANFLEFDIVFKENDYKLIVNNNDFFDALEILFKFEEEFSVFMDKLEKTRLKELVILTKTNENLEDFQSNYQEKIQEYLACFDMKTLKKLSNFSKNFSNAGFNEILKDIVNLPKILPLEEDKKTNNGLQILKELYQKSQDICEKINGIKLIFEILKKFDSPDKFKDNQKKKLNKTVGLNDLKVKFDDMEFEKWVDFLMELREFLEEFMLKYEAKKNCNGKEKVADLKKMLKKVKDVAQKDVLKNLKSFVEKNVN